MSYTAMNHLPVIISILTVITLFTFWLISSVFKNKQQEKVAETVQQVYVGNLSYRVRERELRDYFSDFGDIDQIKIIKNRNTGRSKGFGFVTFASGSGAKKALDAHGTDFEGRALVVRMANPR